MRESARESVRERERERERARERERNAPSQEEENRRLTNLGLLLAGEAARPVAEAPDAVLDGVLLLEAKLRPGLVLLRVLAPAQVLAQCVGLGPAAGQGVRRVLPGLQAFLLLLRAFCYAGLDKYLISRAASVAV